MITPDFRKDHYGSYREIPPAKYQAAAREMSDEELLHAYKYSSEHFLSSGERHAYLRIILQRSISHLLDGDNQSKH